MSGATNMMLSRSSPGTFSAELNVSSVVGHRILKPGVGGTITTSSAVLCTPVNGVAPFTYQWVFNSGSSEIVANLPTHYQTDFSAFFEADVGTSYSGTWKCVITDATSATATSGPVSILLYRG